MEFPFPDGRARPVTAERTTHRLDRISDHEWATADNAITASRVRQVQKIMAGLYAREPVDTSAKG